MWPWRALSHCRANIDAAFTLIDQIKDIGGRLKPFHALVERPFCFRIGIGKRTQQTLDKRMSRWVVTPLASTISSCLPIAALAPFGDGRALRGPPAWLDEPARVRVNEPSILRRFLEYLACTGFLFRRHAKFANLSLNLSPRR